MEKLVYLIRNPISGQGRGRERVEDLCRRLERAGYEVRRQETTHPGEATRLAAAVPAGTRVVLVQGGDGTLRETATGLLDRGIPIYHLAAGNENLFARALRMSTEPAKVAAAVEGGAVRALDVVEVNGRTIWVSVLGVGFDAAVVREVCVGRKGHVNHLSYLWPIWKTLAEYRFPRVIVEADGREVFNRRGLVWLANLPRYAGGLPLLHGSDPADGLMDVVMVPCRGRRSLAVRGALIALWMGRRAGVKRIRARRVRVRSDVELGTQVDGDVGPALPIEAVVRPGALGVLMPGNAMP